MNTNADGARATDWFGIEGGVLPAGCSAITPSPPPGPRFELFGAMMDVWLGGERTQAAAHRIPLAQYCQESGDASVTILLVDDNDKEIIAIRRAFWRLNIANPIVVARDGIEALAMLRGAGREGKLEPPYLVLLELALPRMNGLEFLRELRADPALRPTLVLVFTTSASVADRERAYEQNVAGYVVKPDPGESLLPTIGALESYWRAIMLPD